MNNFKKRLQNLSPVHDTPVGLIHPYWARKPLNIIQELVACFSEVDDLVVDPFLGSGTTAFAALTQGRRIVGADLNPLAVFLTRSLIELSQSPKQKLVSLDSFLEDFSQQVLPLFHYQNNKYVQRERFEVKGEFENGNFELVPTEVVLTTRQKNTFKGRAAEAPIHSWTRTKVPRNLLITPIDFNSLPLLPNSRIAIPSGATLAHYYERKNQAAINVALRLISSGEYGDENTNTLKLLVSASLPLLRLSDKKASSQWPYWRPKTHLTSRNPVIVMRTKAKAIKKASEWLLENLDQKSISDLENYLQLHNVAVQALVPAFLKAELADVVITDPPYSDQAPYLEYSSLWIQLLGLELPNDAYKYEIVKTDAPTRVQDTQEYMLRLGDGLRNCARMLKPNGILVWFYQDHSVQHWATLDKQARKNKLRIVEVIPMPKQRRSMKTVTSPGKTLDGDLILVFRKEEQPPRVSITSKQAIHLLREKQESLPLETSYFDRYAAIIEVGLKHHLMSVLAKRYTDIRDILKSMGDNNVLAP